MGVGQRVLQLAARLRTGSSGVVGPACMPDQRLRSRRVGAQHIAADHREVVALGIGAVGVEARSACPARHRPRPATRALLRGRAIGGDGVHVIAVLGDCTRNAACRSPVTTPPIAEEPHRASTDGHQTQLSTRSASSGSMITALSAEVFRHVDRADIPSVSRGCVALEAAQDRARGAGPEGSGRYAGLSEQRLAECWGAGRAS